MWGIRWFGTMAASGALLLGCEQHTPSLAGERSASSETAFIVTSEAFRNQQPIPKKYTADGDNISPPLHWIGVPPGAKEYALIVEDPDAPHPPWIHWVIYKIPVTVTSLGEAMPHDLNLADPAGAMQGKNSWETVGYRGPDPPPGKMHHYIFRLYALNAPLNVQSGLDRDTLLQNMTGHIVSHGDLIGTYQR